MQKVYDDKDDDYPKKIYHEIYLVRDKTYKVIQYSNHQGQYSNAERVLILDDNYDMTTVIDHIDHGYIPVTIADVLIGDEAGLAMQDWCDNAKIPIENWYDKHVKIDTEYL